MANECYGCAIWKHVIFTFDGQENILILTGTDFVNFKQLTEFVSQ